MSDREIFFIGLFATLLMVIHLAINIVQFRKIGREGDEEARSERESEGA